jgi:hypothetical protein
MTAATFQSTVNVELGFGVVGELFDNSPRRVQPAKIVSGSAANNVIGRAFTVTTADPADGSSSLIAAAGGTGVFAGILCNPKAYALYGDGVSTINPSLTLPNNIVAEFLTEGNLIIQVPAACSIGNQVTYNTSTGALATLASAAFTASQATTVLTVSAITSGTLGVGSIVNTGAAQVTIVSLGTGTGGTGTYNVSESQTVGSGAMTATSVAPSGFKIIEGSTIVKYAPTGANLAVAHFGTNV